MCVFMPLYRNNTLSERRNNVRFSPSPIYGWTNDSQGTNGAQQSPSEKGLNTASETDWGQSDHREYTTEKIYHSSREDSDFGDDEDMAGSDEDRRGV